MHIGAISLRFQPEPDEQLTFVDLKAAAQVSAAASPPLTGGLQYEIPLPVRVVNVQVKTCQTMPSHSSMPSGCERASMQAGAAQLRACYFDTDSGLGVFARLPLSGDSQSGPEAEAGDRYSSSELSAGLICRPLSEQLTHLWLVSELPDTVSWPAGTALVATRCFVHRQASGLTCPAMYSS